MTTSKLPSPGPSKQALFRHQVVSAVQVLVLTGRDLSDAVESVAATAWPVSKGTQHTVSARTVYRWCAAWHRGGLGALEPASRVRTDTSVALPAALVALLRAEKAADAEASVPELLRRAVERGVLADIAEVDRVTVWRACQRLGLPLGRGRSKREADTRRFAHAHRMMMVLVDGKHFRAGARRTKRVALFFLDDATRRGLRAAVGTAESSALFLRGLYEVLRRHGLMDVLYLDRGPGFIADDTQRVVAQLGKHLVLGRARYPQGHGKVERFHLTAWAGLLRSLEAPEVDDDCGALELRLNHFLEEQYDLRPHESLGGESPRARWDADTRPLVWPASDAALREAFVLVERRKVSADHIVRFDGKALETPCGHADTWVELRRNVLDGTVWLPHDGRLVRLHPVDLAANAHARRGATEPAATPSGSPPVPAATLAFQRDFAPVVDAEGGCLDPLTEED